MDISVNLDKWHHEYQHVTRRGNRNGYVYKTPINNRYITMYEFIPSGNGDRVTFYEVYTGRGNGVPINCESFCYEEDEDWVARFNCLDDAISYCKKDKHAPMATQLEHDYYKNHKTYIAYIE